MSRVGIGYDSHRFAEDRKLVLGGVEIPEGPGLAGWSDADVLTHAVTDAVLGAAGLGDLGARFPDTDPAYREARSVELLSQVATLLAEEGWQVVNIDATVIAEQPRLGPFRPDMVRGLASALGIGEESVSVKATTNEGMGFVGRGEGMAAIAVAQIERRGRE